MYYANSTEFYIGLALFALLFIGGYLIDHHFYVSWSPEINTHNPDVTDY